MLFILWRLGVFVFFVHGGTYAAFIVAVVPAPETTDILIKEVVARQEHKGPYYYFPNYLWFGLLHSPLFLTSLLSILLPLLSLN